MIFNNAHPFNMFTKCFQWKPFNKRICNHKASANMSNWYSLFMKFFFKAQVFQFHMFSTFRILVVLWEKNCCRIIIINFQLISNSVDKSKSWNKFLQPIPKNYGLITCHKFSFHSCCSNDGQLPYHFLSCCFSIFHRGRILGYGFNYLWDCLVMLVAFWHGCWPLSSYYIVIRVLFRLCTIQFFMSGLNT